MLVFIIIIAVVAVGALIGLFAAYSKTFYSPKKYMSETESPKIISRHPYHNELNANTQKMIDIPWKFITTRSYDRLTLSARYYAGDDDKPLFICFHGYRGSAVRDFSGIGSFLIREKYPVIIVDERAHWRSGGHTITFGIRERYDVISWIEYANSRFGEDKPICLCGISMGGGTVLMASGLQLPQNVKAILADCPFNDPEDIIRHVCRILKLNPSLCWPAIKLSALIYGRFNINKTTAAEEVKKSTKPILIIHGEDDNFVPGYMSAEVQQANPDMVEYRLIPKAGHGMSYYYATQEYEEIFTDFVNRNVK